MRLLDNLEEFSPSVNRLLTSVKKSNGTKEANLAWKIEKKSTPPFPCLNNAIFVPKLYSYKSSVQCFYVCNDDIMWLLR